MLRPLSWRLMRGAGPALAFTWYPSPIGDEFVGLAPSIAGASSGIV